MPQLITATPYLKKDFSHGTEHYFLQAEVDLQKSIRIA
jgi:hypothetical protein